MEEITIVGVDLGVVLGYPPLWPADPGEEPRTIILRGS